MSQDSPLKTIGVATGICLFCSLFVSVAAVKLAPIQERNKRIDKIENILQVAGIEVGDSDPEQVYNERIEPVLIDLATGKALPEDQYTDVLNPSDFDLKMISGVPEYSHALTKAEDTAGIQRIPNSMVVYKFVDQGQLEKVILPIHGKGLWSTMYGFLALEKDLQTVSGITFYEHGETPGLGGEIDNPNWKASWKGKQAFDPSGQVVIQVIKGQVMPNSDKADQQIDGLSGATLTTRGVDQVIRFWLGDMGYGPFLNTLREAQ